MYPFVWDDFDAVDHGEIGNGCDQRDQSFSHLALSVLYRAEPSRHKSSQTETVKKSVTNLGIGSDRARDMCPMNDFCTADGIEESTIGKTQNRDWEDYEDMPLLKWT